MLLTPFVAAAVLARCFRWQELAALIVIVTVFAMKEPLVVLARQRWVWKQTHPESADAARWVIAEGVVAGVCGLALVLTGPVWIYAALFAGAVTFSVLAVWVNVRNRQRMTAFQVLSAFALTSPSLTAALAATGIVPAWCWPLWGLLAAQATAGIFTIHARLDARIASRTSVAGKTTSRQSAWICCALLAMGSLAAAFSNNYRISAALLLAAAGYAGELRRQTDSESLQTPLKAVGKQALALSVLFAALLVAGLW